VRASRAIYSAATQSLIVQIFRSFFRQLLKLEERAVTPDDDTLLSGDLASVSYFFLEYILASDDQLVQVAIVLFTQLEILPNHFALGLRYTQLALFGENRLAEATLLGAFVHRRGVDGHVRCHSAANLLVCRPITERFEVLIVAIANRACLVEAVWHTDELIDAPS